MNFVNYIVFLDTSAFGVAARETFKSYINEVEMDLVLMIVSVFIIYGVMSVCVLLLFNV